MSKKAAQAASSSRPKAIHRGRKAISKRSAKQVAAAETRSVEAPPPSRTSLATNVFRALALAAVIGITVFVYGLREHIKDFASYGYPGIFLVALLANATVFLPAPGVALVFAMGSIFNPLGVALAAGTGGTLGELSGFLAGFSGQAVVERTALYSRIDPWIDKYGGWAVLVFAAIPNPFFDLAGVAAGVSGMSIWRFLLFCWIGQVIKMSIFAFAGAYSINWLSGFLK